MPPQQSPYHFRGGDDVLKPNHITRYIYPSLFDNHPSYPAYALRLQNPKSVAQRSRPQGEGSWDTTFTTITRAPKPPPTNVQFNAWIVKEKKKDRACENALGRAMRRVSGWPGNTKLECGKFELKPGRFVFVLRRTTILVLGGADKGKYGRDEDWYQVPAEKWRAMKTNDEWDSWWVRLYDLMNATSDRAYFNVQDQLNTLDIRAPIIQWLDHFTQLIHGGIFQPGKASSLPRQDVEKQKGIRLIFDKNHKFADGEDMCFICTGTYFTDADYACQLPCEHYVCIPCMTALYDAADGKPKDNDELKNLGLDDVPFWRCPSCRCVMPIIYDRLDTMQADELPFWRWKTITDLMRKKMTDYYFNNYLQLSAGVRYIDTSNSKNNDEHVTATTWIHSNDAVDFIEKVVKLTHELLPYGYSADNPVKFPESHVLEDAIKKELQRLETTKQKFTVPQLIAHLKEVGEKAFTPCVVSDKKYNLGNPIYPPGYTQYRDFFCEWTARGCFCVPMAVQGYKEFVAKMYTMKGSWWKGDIFLKTG